MRHWELELLSNGRKQHELPLPGLRSHYFSRTKSLPETWMIYFYDDTGLNTMKPGLPHLVLNVLCGSVPVQR